MAVLVGGAVNLAVAWVCIYTADWVSMGVADEAVDTRWPLKVPAHWARPHSTLRGRTTGVSLFRQCSVDGASNCRYFDLDLYEVGWPMRSWRYVHFGEYTVNPITPYTAGHPTSVMVVGVGFGHGWKRLPIMPMWPGIVVNTTMFATGAAPILLVPGWVIRWRRRRRGLCVGCGYPRSSEEREMCPECGRKT